MSITLSTIEFSEAEITNINSALLLLEETFAGKLISDNFAGNFNDAALTNEIENLGDLPADDRTVFLASLPAFNNIAQWGKDEKIREQLNPIALRLKNIARQVVYTNRAVLLRCWNSSAKY